MKKHFLLVFTSLFLSYSFAQNRKIEFEHTDFTAALAKAKAEKKMIFMDCYTTWCGPCKMLAAQIFTQDAVADYFNANFVSVKMDMEKGEGTTLQQKYGVKAYPTLLFINPESEEIHRAMGFIPAEKLIAAAQKAADPNWCNACIATRLKNGERSPELFNTYFLQKQENQELQPGETESFFASVSDADFTSRPFWQLVYNFVGGASTVSGKRLMALRSNFAKEGDFAKATTSDSLEMKIATIYNLYNIVPQQQISDPKILLQTMQDLRKQASEVVLKNPKIAQDMLDSYDIEIMPLTKNGKGLCEAIERNFKGIFVLQDPDMQWNMRLFRSQSIEQFTEAEVLAYAEKWAQEAYKIKPDELYSNLYLGKTLKRCGKNDEAITALERALAIGTKDGSDTKEIEALLGGLKYSKNQVIMGYRMEKNAVVFDFDPKLYATVSGTNGGWSPLKDLTIETVNVAGDFNEWKPNDKMWRLKFNKKTQTYQLSVPISDIKSGEKIALAANKTHIFKFVINGEQWVMPTEKTKNITLEPGKDFAYSNMTIELGKP